MAKPAITKRVTKGSALTYAELDTNFQNLADATVSITADTGGTTVSSDLNGNVTLVAGTGIGISGDNTAKTITITNTSLGSESFKTISVNGTTNVVADSTSDTLTLNGATGVSLSADTATDTITVAGTAYYGEVKDGTANSLAFYASGYSGVAANRTIEDSLISYGNTGTVQTLTSTNSFSLISSNTFDIDAAGAIDFTPGTNSNVTINTTGTGQVTIGGSGILNAAQVNNGGNGVIIDSGTVGITGLTNADIYITPVGTGKLMVMNDMRVGSTTAGTTIEGNWNNASSFLKLRSRNNANSASIDMQNPNLYLTAGTTNGNVYIQPQGSGATTGRTILGDGVNRAAISTLNSTDLRIEPSIAGGTAVVLLSGSANGNITITPNGTGKTVVTNLVATEVVVANGATGVATLTPNAANGAVQSYTVTGNITLNAFGTPIAGQSLTLILTIGGSGGYTLSSTMKFAGASKTISTTVGAVDIITIYYDGTNYWASLSKGFA